MVHAGRAKIADSSLLSIVDVRLATSCSSTCRPMSTKAAFTATLTTMRFVLSFPLFLIHVFSPSPVSHRLTFITLSSSFP
jgi:hypothetical protein